MALPTFESLRVAIEQQGQAYVASTGLLNVAAGTYALSIFNPQASGKSILVRSGQASTGTGGAAIFVQKTTSDPAYGNAATVTNKNIGGSASAIASSVTYVNTNQSNPSSNLLGVFTSGNLTEAQETIPEDGYILPPNNGIIIFINTFASGYNAINIEYVEY